MPWLKVFACLTAGLFLFFSVFLLHLSELIGGWVRKYSSPAPVFTVAAIGNLTGRTALVTGGNTGIGYVTARELARGGANVVITARTDSKGKEAVENIRRDLNERRTDVGQHSDCGKVQNLLLDLNSLSSVEEFVSDFRRLKLPLHILVLNAGVMKSPGAQFVGENFTYGYAVTHDGFEQHIGVNHIGHFYLTRMLEDKLVKSSPSRVVVLSSLSEGGSYEEGMRFDLWLAKESVVPTEYEDGKAYGQSKLANLLFARELAERLEGSGVTAYSCHPGVIGTDLMRYINGHLHLESKGDGFVSNLIKWVVGTYFSMAFFSPEDGALTQLYLATVETEKLVNGGFYHPIGRVENSTHREGQNVTLQKKLWSETEKAIRSKVGTLAKMRCAARGICSV